MQCGTSFAVVLIVRVAVRLCRRRAYFEFPPALPVIFGQYQKSEFTGSWYSSCIEMSERSIRRNARENRKWRARKEAVFGSKSPRIAASALLKIHAASLAISFGDAGGAISHPMQQPFQLPKRGQRSETRQRNDGLTAGKYVGVAFKK